MKVIIPVTEKEMSEELDDRVTHSVIKQSDVRKI